MKTLKSTGEVIRNSSSSLQHILDHARVLEQLTRRLRRHLEPALAPHCQVANYREGTLVISTDSPVWATRLRYQLPQLRRQLAADHSLQGLSDIRLRVRPASRPLREQLPPPEPLSRDSALLISGIAESISDPGLRSALLRFARHGLDRSTDEQGNQ